LDYSFFVVFNVVSQAKKELTLEDFFVKRSLYGRSVCGIKWMNDGAYYTSLKTNIENGAKYVIWYSIETGDAVDTLISSLDILLDDNQEPFRFDSYEFSADESKMLWLMQGSNFNHFFPDRNIGYMVETLLFIFSLWWLNIYKISSDILFAFQKKQGCHSYRECTIWI